MTLNFIGYITCSENSAENSLEKPMFSNLNTTTVFHSGAQKPLILRIAIFLSEEFSKSVFKLANPLTSLFFKSFEF